MSLLRRDEHGSTDSSEAVDFVAGDDCPCEARVLPENVVIAFSSHAGCGLFERLLCRKRCVTTWVCNAIAYIMYSYVCTNIHNIEYVLHFIHSAILYISRADQWDADAFTRPAGCESSLKPSEQKRSLFRVRGRNASAVGLHRM